MKLEFPSHAQHLSFEKFRKCNLRNSYRKLFKQVHVYINYIFLIKISKNKKNKKISAVWNDYRALGTICNDRGVQGSILVGVQGAMPPETSEIWHIGVPNRGQKPLS